MRFVQPAVRRDWRYRVHCLFGHCQSRAHGVLRRSGDPAQGGVLGAVIALSAKMAKGRRHCRAGKVRAFQGDIRPITAGEAGNVARALQSRQAGLWPATRPMPSGYRHVRVGRQAIAPCSRSSLDGLFHIPKADGVIHHKELEFIPNVADIFHVDEGHFDWNPGAAMSTPMGLSLCGFLVAFRDHRLSTEVKKRYRALDFGEPSRPAARTRGAEEDFLTIANDRMAALNEAFAVIEKAPAAAMVVFSPIMPPPASVRRPFMARAERPDA